MTLLEKAVTVFDKSLDSTNERIRLTAASHLMHHVSRVQIGPSRAGAIRTLRHLEELGDINNGSLIE